MAQCSYFHFHAYFVIFFHLHSWLYSLVMFFYDFALPTHYCDLTKQRLRGRKMHTLLLSFSHLCFHFFTSPKFKVAGVYLVLCLSPGSVRVHAPYPAAAVPVTVTVTCVLYGLVGVCLAVSSENKV